jgi:hypothetical protein
MAFYIQEKRSPRGQYTTGGSMARRYATYAEAKAMKDDLDEHGGCGPLRIVNEKMEVQTGD